MTPTSVSLSRRQALKGASAFALTLVAAGLLAPQAHADAKMVEEAIKKLVKGTPEEGKIKLDLPQIALHQLRHYNVFMSVGAWVRAAACAARAVRVCVFRGDTARPIIEPITEDCVGVQRS